MLRALRAVRPKILSTSSLSRTYASVTDIARYPAPGEQIHGFTLKRTKHVPELQLTALNLEHNKTGADYLHIARDDSNNVFSISFKTNPPDATGVPHILEHTTLCGSQRYPVRDPFFKMLPRTLSNYMNAFTTADHTTYPFATANNQDYKNLMSVYLDCTLNPLLKESDFTQEGWRLGPENPAATADDPSSKIVFKGVVYNEMKGQMSDAGYLYYIRFNEHLFPAINNSGGDPQHMTELTYNQLRDFHAQNYHPSNSRILTYGNMPLDEHLQFVGPKLDAFTRSKPNNAVKLPGPISDTTNITIPGPVDPMAPFDSQHKTSVTWLMGSISNTLENFSLSLMTSLLTDGYGSPMYRNLIEAGLGTEWSPNTGYDGSAGTAVFSIGLSGVQADNVDKVKQAIFQTLQDTRRNGFDQSKIDGSLHQLELALKHKTANFGMSLMQRLLPGWFNGVDAFDLLEWQKTVDAFRTECAKGGYLESLLERYLINQHYMIFTMEPSRSYGVNIIKEEETRLAAKIDEAAATHGGLAQGIQKLREMEIALVALQNEEQDLSCLPTVRVKDIPLLKQTATTLDKPVTGVTTQWLEAPTNGLTYFRALSLVDNLPSYLRTFVPLFCDALMRIGTKTKSMEQIEDLIKLKTGGVSFGYYSCSSPESTGVCHEGLSLSGFALDRNVPAMYDIITMLLNDTDFDGPKAHGLVAELLQSAASGVVDNIANSGHVFARRHAEAGLTRQGLYNEQTGGVTQAANITALVARPDLETDVASELIKALKAIRDIVLGNMNNMRVAITCGAQQGLENRSALERFLTGTFSESESTPAAMQTELSLRDWSSTYKAGARTVFDLPYQVSYSGLCLPTVPYTDAFSPPLAILAKLLTNKHLHREIREKGGAYGGGAYSRALDGIFGFYSYRDPNPENTLNVISNVGVWAAAQQWAAQDIEEAKLSVFQSIDAPKAVSSEGMTRFLSGITPEMEQKRRAALLGVTREQITDAAQRFLSRGIEASNATILGPVKPFIKASDGWVVERLGLADASQAEAVDGAIPATT